MDTDWQQMNLIGDRVQRELFISVRLNPFHCLGSSHAHIREVGVSNFVLFGPPAALVIHFTTHMMLTSQSWGETKIVPYRG